MYKNNSKGLSKPVVDYLERIIKDNYNGDACGFIRENMNILIDIENKKKEENKNSDNYNL